MFMVLMAENGHMKLHVHIVSLTLIMRENEKLFQV